MAGTSVQDIIWRLNPDRSVDIVQGGEILETTTVVLAPSRLQEHRNAAARAAERAPAPAPLYFRQDGRPVTRKPRSRR